MSYQPKVYKKQGGAELVVASSGLITVESGGLVVDAVNAMARSIRTRFTIAQVNAGATILAAIAGYKYRLIDAYAISVGGAAAAVTTVDILATQATSSVKLVAFGQAALTQSAMVRAGSAGGVILADGASFVQNDVNTALTINKTGASVTTATHIDVVVTYAIEA